MTKTDEIIEEYKKTYLEIRGKEIKVIKRGSWLYVNDNPYRASDLAQYTLNLIENGHLKPPPDDDEPGIRELVKMIQSDGRRVFLSKNIKETQLLGKLIVKRAKRILNLYDAWKMKELQKILKGES